MPSRTPAELVGTECMFCDEPRKEGWEKFAPYCSADCVSFVNNILDEERRTWEEVFPNEPFGF